MEWHELDNRNYMFRDRPDKENDPIAVKFPMQKTVLTMKQNVYIYNFDSDGIRWTLLGNAYSDDY